MPNEIRAKASNFGLFLDRTVGKVGYLNGTRGELCTQAMINYRLSSIRYIKYWPTIRASAAQWNGKIVADCTGWFEMFLNGGDVGKPLTTFKYMDFETFWLQARAKEWGLDGGLIATLPRNCPYPIAVGYPGHIGYFYKGMVYQSAGHRSGTIITPLEETVHNSKWLDWYILPFLDYEGWTVEGGEIMLQKPMKGAAVYDYQAALKKLGYDTGKWLDMYDQKTPNGLDGSFGDAMVELTKKAQENYKLAKTGVVDAALYGKIAKDLMALQPIGIPEEQYNGVVVALSQKVIELRECHEILYKSTTDLKTANGTISTLNERLNLYIKSNNDAIDIIENVRKHIEFLKNF